MINLSANAAYGHGGKQYIAHITGRDAKFTFARDFVGRKTDKRGEYSTYDTDEPGLYVECDVDKHGSKTETYRLVYNLPGYGLTTCKPDKKEIMDMAKRLDKEVLDWTKEALALRLKWALTKDQDEEIEIIAQLGLPAGKVIRRDLVSALKRVLSGENPKAEAIARVKTLMVELGVEISDLA